MSVGSFFHKIADVFISKGEQTLGDIGKIETVIEKDAAELAPFTKPVVALVQTIGQRAITTAIDTEIAFGVTPPAQPGTTPATALAPAIAGPAKATATGLTLFAQYVEGIPAGVVLSDAQKAYNACVAIAGANHDLLDSLSPAAKA